MMRVFLALFVACCWQATAFAQTPVTCKCWCTWHGEVEKEYASHGCVLSRSSITIPIELPVYGHVLCEVSEDEGTEDTSVTPAVKTPGYLHVTLSSLQMLQATEGGGSLPGIIMSGTFLTVFKKRILILDTPTFSISIELLKD